MLAKTFDLYRTVSMYAYVPKNYIATLPASGIAKAGTGKAQTQPILFSV